MKKFSCLVVLAAIALPRHRVGRLHLSEDDRRRLPNGNSATRDEMVAGKKVR